MAGFPDIRLRRLRRTAGMRALVKETRLSVEDLICPLFVVEGKGLEQPIDSMPGVMRHSPDMLPVVVRDLASAGIPAVILFGIPQTKDETGSAAYQPDGLVQQAVTIIKDAVPDIVVITDVCLCEYTSHGHCGVLNERREVDNDRTLEYLARIALTHAQAGADIVAPSDMMDGRVGYIRNALDMQELGMTAIMSYAAKYASAFYGPFRDAAECAPQFGDRRSYQMDPANAREALREVRQDLSEGADIIMVKPALAYLDIVQKVRQTFDCPVAAYNVSGEYAMIKAAAARGMIDERTAAMEVLTSIKRAGADMIITYHARDAAFWLRETL